MKKFRRNPIMEDYYNSLEFALHHDLDEEYHEVRYFDDFIDNINVILSEHEDEDEFYTGWNYKPIKEEIHGRYKKYGLCRNMDNKDIDVPIYIKKDYFPNKTHTSVNRKSDRIVITLYYYNLNMDFLKYSLLHELTHVVTDYSEKDHANLDSLKNTIGYDVDVFDIYKSNTSDDKYIQIMEMLYWLNKSE